ncbi:helix-turn-helix transcriptional regulator [Nocardia yamanashiensis]|uniref:helix-turn-helix transcriptional regulator n=1 Tax=Nocardia yamanashiensis TaxID=209247 RepID=UPI000835FC57|nr:LuxR family transcriptional regulator [Nocardia yamanashiensis]
MLYGRSAELGRIDALIAAAADGRGGALAVLGDPGEGKSALLRRAAELVDDSWRVLRCSGIESESELPFAGLQLLLYPVLDRVEQLPAVHRDTLRGALGLSAVTPIDRFMVGRATVALLAELAAAGPLLCLIDDAQWLDRPSADALLFAAHRLGGDRALLIFAARPPYAPRVTQRMRLSPLDAEQSRALLRDRFPALLPERRDRVLAEAAGNPLAVLELPRMDLDAHPIGPLPLPDRLRLGYQDQIAAQSETARLALLVAAAEETGDARVVRGALRRLGLGDEALTAAERTCMVSVSGDTVSFRHPLKRAAAYQLAPFTQRLAVHAALAEALAGDPDRQAWHLAFATAAPDETVAATLESAADRAYDRAAYAAAASAFERAANLSPDRIRRGARRIRAVEALADAGRPEQALAQADRIDATALDVVDRATMRNLRARMAFEYGSIAAAYELSLGAADELAATHPEQAAVALMDAARAAWTTGDLPAAQTAVRRMRELRLDTAWAPLLAAVEGPNLLFTGQFEAGAAAIRAAVAACRDLPDPALRFLLALLAALTGDTDDAHELLLEVAGAYTARGMICRTPAVHASLATTQLLLGQFAAAEASCLLAAQTAEASCLDVGRFNDGGELPNRVLHAESILAVLNAIRGDADRCRELTERQARRAERGRNTIDAAHCEWALLLLDLAQGNFEAAVHRGEALGTGPLRPLGQWPHLLADRVEAAVRHRTPDRAAAPYAALAAFADATGTTWIRALRLRCQALLDGDPARFEQALALHATAERRFDHARTELLYGEWLRRNRRLLTARTHLSSASVTFERLRARPWADRAYAELCAAGGVPIRGEQGDGANSTAAQPTSEWNELATVRGGSGDTHVPNAPGSRNAPDTNGRGRRAAAASRIAAVLDGAGISESRSADRDVDNDPRGCGAATGQRITAIRKVQTGWLFSPPAPRRHTPGNRPDHTEATVATRGTSGVLDVLTPQEMQVVRLAARGATNNEIGARLSISPKTVGHHLYRAFPKLGVRSRVELARLVPIEEE